VLAVLRPRNADQARLQLQLLQKAGLCHVELAVSLDPDWPRWVRVLVHDFPALSLGAASVRCSADLDAAIAAGLGYAVSPILERSLLQRSAAAAIPLVPGVFSPSEIAAAVAWGAPAVKLYPAASLGPQYWQRLAGPLQPLPFCIAAGGLAVADVEPWLEAGVNAVALGSSLFRRGDQGLMLEPGLPSLLQRLQRSDKP
jgi:2-dehydro-3-deoxyphosphogluconate aldolase/(4S)-4-hydroxy-2-oxoglutarate aldolase